MGVFNQLMIKILSLALKQLIKTLNLKRGYFLVNF